MRDTEEQNTGDATSFGEALGEAFSVVLEMQNLVEVTCPHPGCNEKTAVPALGADEAVLMARNMAISDDDHEGRCSAGHEVFVHYY